MNCIDENKVFMHEFHVVLESFLKRGQDALRHGFQGSSISAEISNFFPYSESDRQNLHWKSGR